VKGAVEQIDDLIGTVPDYPAPPNYADSLRSKLEAIKMAITSASAAERADAAHQLDAFIRTVEAQRGKKLTDAQAQALIDAANAIKASL
jgi:hypothetical protein